MRYKARYRRASSTSLLSPFTIVTCFILWLHIIGNHASGYGNCAHLSLNPELYRGFTADFISKKINPLHQAFTFPPNNRNSFTESDDTEEINEKPIGRDVLKSYLYGGTEKDYSFVPRNKFNPNSNSEEDDDGLKQQRSGAVREQTAHQSIPREFLFPRHFLTSPTALNQANGLSDDKVPSKDPKTKGRWGMLSSINDSELDAKQLATRSRPYRFFSFKRSHSPGISATQEAHSGMCHFKLCQLGVSGKQRRWNPLFRYH